MIEIGLALIRQKGRLPHGSFLPWIEAEFGMTSSSVSRFMQIADRFGADELPNLGNLPPSALYELAALSNPPEVRDQVETLLVDGQKVTDIKHLKD